jgi:hypothetical protein
MAQFSSSFLSYSLYYANQMARLVLGGFEEALVRWGDGERRLEVLMGFDSM